MATRAELERALLLVREMRRRKPWRPLPAKVAGAVSPQQMAYESLADITGYGGAAGGGKTDLIAGLTLTKHKRALIVRREKAQTEGVVQRLEEILGSKDGYNSQKSIWKLPNMLGTLVEFGGLDNPGDERRWQGRPHDLKCFDEVTEMREAQVRFLLGWVRTNDPTVRPRAIMTFNPPTTVEGRWVIKFFAPWLEVNHHNPAVPGELRYFTTVGDNQDYELADGRPFVLVDGEPEYDFDPEDYPLEKIIKPKSRTFIPARLTDNPYYMATDYMSQLQALPEPLRSQMLNGDFAAGIEDDAMQVIPTEWVEIAMARWKPRMPKPTMDSMGVDVARGGKDRTVLSRRHDMWFDELLEYAGKKTPDGQAVVGLVISNLRDQAPIHLDLIGVGTSPFDQLRDARQQVLGVNVSEATQGKDKSGRLGFKNIRSELWWRMREALDPAANNGIELPPNQELKSELCTPRWRMVSAKIQVESKDEIVADLRRSPDLASALVLALMDTPRLRDMPGYGARKTGEYDPYAVLPGHAGRAPGEYDPYAR